MIYLDNAATTKPNKNAIEYANKFNDEFFYNPSAMYCLGLNNYKEINLAKQNIISFIANKNNYNGIFVSCGSEADNQAIFSFCRHGNIITSAGEHSAIFNSVKELKNRGIDVRFAKLDKFGNVDIDNLLNLIDENTSLVSLIHVNNETGAINDINKIAKLIKNKNANLKFHSDGVQAFGKIPIKLSTDIDMYSISAHKIGGLKGNGMLIYKKNLAIKPLIFGGGQENGLRSGTENIFGIKIFEYASKEKYLNINKNFEKALTLKKTFLKYLNNDIFTVISSEDASPYIVSISAGNVRGEVLMHMLENNGVVCGTGSACSSKNRFSRILTECGYNKDILDGVLRISITEDNTQEEIIKAVTIINEQALILNKKINL